MAPVLGARSQPLITREVPTGSIVIGLWPWSRLYCSRDFFAAPDPGSISLSNRSLLPLPTRELLVNPCQFRWVTLSCPVGWSSSAMVSPLGLEPCSGGPRTAQSVCDPNQCFSKCKMRKNPLEILLKWQYRSPLGPGGLRGDAFPTGSQMMLMLPAHRPHVTSKALTQWFSHFGSEPPRERDKNTKAQGLFSFQKPGSQWAVLALQGILTHTRV